MINKLVIDRTRWLRGEGIGSGLLLRSTDQKMCCIGFFCVAAGCTPDEILERATPAAILNQPNHNIPKERRDQILAALTQLGVELVPLRGDEHYQQNDTTQKLFPINDTATYSELGREAEVVELFARMGVEVTFIN